MAALTHIVRTQNILGEKHKLEEYDTKYGESQVEHSKRKGNPIKVSLEIKEGPYASYHKIELDTASIQNPIVAVKKVDCSYNSNGQVHGHYQQWHENGTKYIDTHYNNGRLNGDWTSFYDNGVKEMVCSYKHDNLDGKYARWDSNGEVVVECEFNNGKMKLSDDYEHYIKRVDDKDSADYGKTVCGVRRV